MQRTLSQSNDIKFSQNLAHIRALRKIILFISVKDKNFALMSTLLLGFVVTVTLHSLCLSLSRYRGDISFRMKMGSNLISFEGDMTLKVVL